jgi:hypothetical protein
MMNTEATYLLPGWNQGLILWSLQKTHLYSGEGIIPFPEPHLLTSMMFQEFFELPC